MKLTTHLRGDHSRRLNGDQGYVIALTALLMLPLMAFTSLAVDMGYWYARAAQIQRASDAAALAGVVQLPNLNAARTAACNTLALNGFPTVGGNCSGGGGATVIADITQVPDLTYKLKVDLRDTKVNQFFSKIFKPSGVTVNRGAIGQYVKPTTMGSARNFLGTGTLNMGSGATTYRDNFWLAVSGGCSSKEQGERYTTTSDANYSNVANPAASKSGPTCSGGNTVSNVEYQANYYYQVSFSPTYSGGSQIIQVYSPGSGCGAPEDDSGGGTTTFQMLNPGSPSTSTPFGSPLSTSACGWNTLATITPNPGDTWFVRVTPSSTGVGSNSFALRASPGAWSTTSACSSDPADTTFTYNATCPNVAGYGAMGVYANQAGTQADFYLAQTLASDNGKQMQVDLWDPGEGAWALEILDPLNNPADFTWNVLCWNPQNAWGGTCTDVQPSGGVSGNSTDLSLPTTPTATSFPKALDLLGFTRNVSTTDTSPVASPTCSTIPCSWQNPAPSGTAPGGGWNKQPWGYRTSNSKYNDRLLRLVIQLPNDIPATYSCGSGCFRSWWKIRYKTGLASVTDRTTWTVTMKGSPVRLIPE